MSRDSRDAGIGTQALWATARRAGLSRRRFLALLASGGAAAVLAACGGSSSTPTTAGTTATATQAAAASTATSAPTAQATSAASPAASATPAAAGTPGVTGVTEVAQLINKPIPTQYFIPMGSNAEMRFEVMANRGATMPNSFFFVRTHKASVIVDAKTWQLSVEGDGVESPYKLTYDELLQLPAKTVTRYVECAGNGRSFYQSLLNKPAQGGQWHLGAYGIAEWTGVPLSDLLQRAKIKSSAVHVMPIGLDKPQVRRPMPVAKAMEADTMLVYAMNGEILPIDHGFPARMLVPGWVGVSNIKWVRAITVSEKPLQVEWNTASYVMIGPDYTPAPPAKGPAVNDQVMKSALTLPWPATLKAGSQTVTGFAWTPNGKIAKVDVSTDGGKTWNPAKLIEPNIERAGVRWEFTFDAKPGDMTITPRATDEKGNTQPEVSQQKWNEQGYVFGAIVPHPVKVV